MIEAQYRRTMQINLGDKGVFIDGTYPIATAILAIAVVLFVGPKLWDVRQRRKRTEPS
jgi:TctA family transporter